ncbi:MAG: FecR family protein [Chitinophagaceae bacterium]
MRNLFTKKNKEKTSAEHSETGDPDWDAVSDIDEGSIDWADTWNTIKRDVGNYQKRKDAVKRVVTGSLMLLFVVGSTMYYIGYHKTQSAAYATLYNKGHHELYYLLSDSSRMVLFPGTTVRLPESYNQHTRELFVQGKALFIVHKDRTKPFIVHSAHLATCAIGTEFVVENRPDEQKELVYLEEGIVQVNVKGSNVSHILAVKDTLHYNIAKQVVSIAHYRPAMPLSKNYAHRGTGGQKNHVSRKDKSVQRLQWYSFDNASLEDIFGHLENIYGIEIRYTKADVVEKYFIGKFSSTDSLSHILDVITSLNELRYKEVADGVYTVYK